MSNFERKFGKYAIPNLPLVMIICYVIGYVISLFNSNLLFYFMLDPYQILHGQVWRLVTWLLVPPSGIGGGGNLMDWFLTVVMLYFYYSIGTNLERTWGTYRYNVYIFGGVLLTILSSFLYLGVVYLQNALAGPAAMPEAGLQMTFMVSSLYFSTYYINMSIFLAFAATYPNAQVLLMFVIPIKVKWLGIIYLVMLVYEMFQGGIVTIFAIGASLINFGIFYLMTRNLSHLKPKEVKRRTQFKQQVHQAQKMSGHHKCAVCGQTDVDAPELEFRYCSKCNGNYEYCQNHLFTHEHVK